MNSETVFAALGGDFIVAESQGYLFEQGNLVYAKKIKSGIYLMFSRKTPRDKSPIEAVIADFDGIANVTRQIPTQLLFHIRMTDKRNLKYLKKFLSVF